MVATAVEPWLLQAVPRREEEGHQVRGKEEGA